MMDFFAEVAGDYRPFLWLIFALLGVFVYSSSLSDPIYGNFEKVGGDIFDWIFWKPVYRNVHDGYGRDCIVMPQTYLADLRGGDSKALSFFQNIQDALWLKPTVGDLYTAESGERMVDVVKRGINPRLPQIVPHMIEEVDYAFDFELGNSNDKKEVVAFEFFGSVSMRVAIRMLIGKDLCRDPQFLEASNSFTMSTFGTALVITKSLLGPFRPILAGLLSIPHKWKLQACCNIILPVLEKRIEEGPISDSDQDFDGLDFVLAKRNPSSHRDKTENIAIELMHNLWAASSAPGGMIAEVVYQLLANREYLEPLRKEASNSVEQHGWSDRMLSSLEVQDSFIREVNRLFPTGAMGIARTVMTKNFRCADGLTLPSGTRIVFPIQDIQQDCANFTNGRSFDGYRFVRDSDAGSDQPRDNATTMGLSNLAWGYGNHMCPGRFFAIRECKIVLTKLLLEYDFDWDWKKEGKPPRWHVEGQFVPNMKQKITLRRRHELANVDKSNN